MSISSAGKHALFLAEKGEDNSELFSGSHQVLHVSVRYITHREPSTEVVCILSHQPDIYMMLKAK